MHIYNVTHFLYYEYVRRKKNTYAANHFFIVVSYSTVSIATLVLVAIVYQLVPLGEVPCANTISCTSPPALEIVQNAVGVFHGQRVNAPNVSLTQDYGANPVLGTETSRGEKHIYVNLETQMISAFEGDNLFMHTPVSTGLWGRTPKGDFTIWTKFRATRMSGGSGADYYDLPNVPYVMFFSNNEVSASRGFSIHGTYWHNNFGHAMSHGCVNMKTTDVAKLFAWADGPGGGTGGTTITIYGDPPM